MTNLRLRYQTIEFGETDIHLCTLRDSQQFYDPEGVAETLGISSANWSLFGIIWPSSLALAHFVDSYDVNGKRILEVGCGIALPSLLLNSKAEDITATDYHPEAEIFLKRNTNLNNDTDISFEQVDWKNESQALGSFDLIIGSDLLYEDQHVELLANFINLHSKPVCEIILVDPGRGRKSRLSKKLEALGFKGMLHENNTAYLDATKDFKGHILKLVRC